jgi:hypothetical protein
VTFGVGARWLEGARDGRYSNDVEPMAWGARRSGDGDS